METEYQLWSKGPFSVVFENDGDGIEVAIKLSSTSAAALLGTLDPLDALHQVEAWIHLHLGNLAPELRDALRNGLMIKMGLGHLVGWKPPIAAAPAIAVPPAEPGSSQVPPVTPEIPPTEEP